MQPDKLWCERPQVRVPASGRCCRSAHVASRLNCARVKTAVHVQVLTPRARCAGPQTGRADAEMSRRPHRVFLLRRLVHVRVAGPIAGTVRAHGAFTRVY